MSVTALIESVVDLFNSGVVTFSKASFKAEVLFKAGIGDSAHER